MASIFAQNMLRLAQRGAPVPQRQALQRAIALQSEPMRAREGLVPYTTGGYTGQPTGHRAGGIQTIGQRYGSEYGRPSYGMGQALFREFQGALGARPFAALQEQPPEYFDAVRRSLKEQLRDEFFGSGGRFEAATAAESAAGRLDSPVARKILADTVTEPFMESAAQIDRNVLQLQLESRDRIQQANAELQRNYNDLAARVSMAERGLLSQEQVAQLDADLRGYEARLEFETQAGRVAAENYRALLEDTRRGQELSLDYLRTPIEYDASTQPVASRLNAAFGGVGLPSGGPRLLDTPNNAFFEPGRQTNWTPQYNALPAQGRFEGEIVRGPDGRNYAWRSNHWVVVYG